mmetsp:Transcript_86577/g.231234  ORF Transcript_86577/g.231234 Transcript_86577/m.231234 type:complete len:182 (+) Transcript_86577:2-547(+)
MIRNPHSREQLTPEQARLIFSIGCKTVSDVRNATSVRLGKMFGVSGKTIRDIWTGRTWFNSTRDLWEDGRQPVQRRAKRLQPTHKTITNQAQFPARKLNDVQSLGSFSHSSDVFQVSEKVADGSSYEAPHCLLPPMQTTTNAFAPGFIENRHPLYLPPLFSVLAMNTTFTMKQSLKNLCAK